MPQTDDTTKFIFDELVALKEKIDHIEGLPEPLMDRLQKILQRLNRMAQTGSYSSEFDTMSHYIDVVSTIPWKMRTTDILDLAGAKRILDESHYGMDQVKERIMEYLATMILIKQRGGDMIAKSPVLLFVGLQGVGKTTLSISIAKALGREFVRIPMGGIGSTLEVRGRSKAYPEAEPGQIIKALIRAKVKNPVILLDEVEKASGERGLLQDIMAILLEILDPSQNKDFRDHYVDFPFDLSEALFICSANNIGTLSAALLDRMEVIKMPSYTDEEKRVIAKTYILPKVMEKSGLKEGELIIDDNLWQGIIRPFGFDSGIRSLQRTLEAISRKIAKQIVEGSVTSVTLTAENLKQYLPQ